MHFKFFSGEEKDDMPEQEASGWFFFAPFEVVRPVCQYLSDLWFLSAPANCLTELFFALRGVSAKAVFSLVMFSQISGAAGRRIAFDHGAPVGSLDLCQATADFSGYSHCKNFSIVGENNLPLAQGVFGLRATQPDVYQIYLQQFNLTSVEHLLKDLLNQDPNSIGPGIHKGCRSLHKWIVHGLSGDDGIKVEIQTVISGLKDSACWQFRENFAAAAQQADEYSMLRSGEMIVFLLSMAALVWLGVCLHRVHRRRQLILPFYAETAIREMSTDDDAMVQRKLNRFRNEKGEVMIEMEPPEELICPILGDLMTDPVRAADGRCYQRKNIKTWFATSNKSPVINMTMPNKVLHPDWDKRNALVAFLDHAYEARLAAMEETGLTDDGSCRRRQIGP